LNIIAFHKDIVYRALFIPYRRNKKEKLEASKTKRKRRRLEDVELGEGNPSDFLLDDATGKHILLMANNHTT